MWDGDEFCVQLDEHGEVVLVESGVGASVPTELAVLARAAVAAGTGPLLFLWADPAGRFWRVRVDPAMSRLRTATLHTERVDVLPYQLSRRELDVLTLLVGGLTNAQIAARLVLSARTVSTHLDRVLGKLAAPSRTAAAVRALDEGLVKVPVPGGADALRLLRLGRAAAGMAPGRSSWRPPRRRALRIGAALPLRGSAAPDGREMLRGALLAEEEINRRGGVAGRALEIRSVDVDINSTAVRAGLATLVDQDVDALTSGYLAHQDIAHEFAADTGLPYLHAATMGVMEERVAEDPGRYGRIFQLCPSDVHYAPRFVTFVSMLRDRGDWLPSSNRLVVLQQSNWRLIDFGVRAAEVLADAAGWRLEVHRVGPGDTAWAGAAARVGGTEPAAVMLGSYFVDDHMSFVRRFRDNPSRTLAYSIYAPSVPELRARLGGAADGLLWATTTGTYADRIGMSFVREYAQRFGEPPGRSHAGIAYDRVMLLARAWAQVEDFRDFGAVAQVLRHTPHRGVNGSYYLGSPSQTALGYVDQTGDPSLSQAHLVYQIQAGQQVIISPAPYTAGSFHLPPWFPS